MGHAGHARAYPNPFPFSPCINLAKLTMRQARLPAASEAVSPVIGVILMVAITVVVSAVVFVLANSLGKTENDLPQLSMVVDAQIGAPGGILTVSHVINGPIAMGDILVGGTSHQADPCTWDHTTGNVQPGYQLTCPAAGTITITETTRQILLYSAVLS